MIALLVSLVLADTIDLDAVPTEATVYADRARVTRSGRVQLNRGTHEVVFRGLPLGADATSLTADVTGSAELLDIQVRTVSAVEAADERVAALADILQSLRDQQQDLQDDKASAEARLAAVAVARTQSAAQLSAQLLVANSGPSKADALQSELSDEDAAARAAIRVADRALRRVGDELAAREREMSDLGSNTADTLTVTVRVDVRSGGAVGVDLAYTVPGARWAPRYDLRGDASTGAVTLALSAVVTQRTGEDWRDVSLSVSSARPGRGTDVPELDPFWLNLPRPAPVSRSAERGRSNAMDSAAPMMEMQTAPPPPMERIEAVVDTQLAATTFRVDGTEDLASDGSSRKVLLTTVELDGALRHVSVPRIDPTAYLVGEVTNTATFPLLPGPAGVFVDGDYVGEIRLETVPSGETFDVSFGPDDRVSVTRTRVQTSTGNSGPVGRRQSAEWAWQLAVRSSHPRPVTVDLMEQVPVSARDDVSVSWQVTAGDPAVREDDGGVLVFTLPVPATGQTSMAWGYTITYPGDLTLGWME